MNFKHNKFEDSEVMRSLEKLAVQKGLVKAPEATITKEASAKLSATGNLTQDIVTLCEGLRTSGFTKEANEIESNFIMFKQADTLYQTSKETGEDLVDAAHPDGSHQLSGLKHKVLTITDRHQEILDKVNKKPSGKLATSQQIINAVKKALGQGTSIADKIEEYRTLYSESLESMQQAVSLYGEILNEVERRSAGYETGKVKVKGTEYDVPVVFAPAESYNQSFKILGEEVNRVPAEDEFEEIKNKIEKFKSRINSSWFFGAGGLTNKDRDAIYSKLGGSATANSIGGSSGTAASGVIGFIDTAASKAREANNKLLELRKTSFSSNKKDIFQAIKETFTSLKEIKKSVEENEDLRVIPYKRLRFTPENFIKQIDKLIKELTDLNKQLKSPEINYEQIEEIKTRVDKIKSTAAAAKTATDALISTLAEPVEETPQQKAAREARERAAAEAAQKTRSEAESKANEEKVNKIKENINFFKQDYIRYAQLLGNKPDNVQIGPAKTPRKQYFQKINTAFTDTSTYANLESLKAKFPRYARVKNDAEFLNTVVILTDGWNSSMDAALQELDKSEFSADDGMVSAATLNAMKALKISLGEGSLQLACKHFLKLAKNRVNNYIKFINPFLNDIIQNRIEQGHLTGFEEHLNKLNLINATLSGLTNKSSYDDADYGTIGQLDDELYNISKGMEKYTITALNQPNEAKLYQFLVGDSGISSIGKAKNDLYHAGQCLAAVGTLNAKLKYALPTDETIKWYKSLAGDTSSEAELKESESAETESSTTVNTDSTNSESLQDKAKKYLESFKKLQQTINRRKSIPPLNKYPKAVANCDKRIESIQKILNEYSFLLNKDIDKEALDTYVPKLEKLLGKKTEGFNKLYTKALEKEKSSS